MDNIKLGHIDRGNNALMGLARGLQNVIYLRAKMGQVRLKHRLRYGLRNGELLLCCGENVKGMENGVRQGVDCSLCVRSNEMCGEHRTGIRAASSLNSQLNCCHTNTLSVWLQINPTHKSNGMCFNCSLILF